MPKTITNVKTGVKKKIQPATPSWRAVLADIQYDIGRLEQMARIVERKIEAGEPWLGSVTRLHAQSEGQHEEQQHSV